MLGTVRSILYLACLAALAVGCSDNTPSTADRTTPTPPQTARKTGTAPPKTARRHLRVPILMYHVIGDPRAGAPYPELYVSWSDFAGQMRWLERHGYSVVTLRAVWKHWHGRSDLPVRPIVITFDDGYRGTATRAAPTLAAHGWPGVLNLDLSNVKASEGFGENRIRRLVAAGWELDSHTLTHPDLTTVDSGRLRREVAGSRMAIRKRFGVQAAFFCYPSGRFDERVVNAVKAAGYLGATTTIYGLADRHDPYRLARVRINRSDGVGGFASKLTTLEPR